MGFGRKWVNRMKRCITTTSFSVLITGSLEGFFKISRGLRQGDPLSPYPFVLDMEVFSIMMDKAAQEGLMSGYKIVNREGEEVQITHLLFADDTLVFCKDSKDQMAYLSWILLWFEAFPGLKINLDKSTMLAMGNVDDIEGLAMELGCSTRILPTNYLGLPLVARRNSNLCLGHPVKPAHLHNFPISASKGRIVMPGEDPKRFPLRW